MVAALLAIGGCGGGGTGGSGVTPTPTPAPAPTPTPTPGSAAVTVAAAMSPGINLGNTLEAYNATGPFPYSTSQETWWGNPAANQAIFDAYAAAGFKSVRIPVSWSMYADADDTISAAWMNRVKEVVDMARAAGLYVMINIHWDGGWIEARPADKDAVNARMNKFWTQIANNFKNYDNHLLFAAMNEIGNPDTPLGAPTTADCETQQSLNQTFVNTVRATGGNNSTRVLVLPGYWTNIDYTLQCNATLPADTTTNGLIVEVHYYDPYNFTINDSSSIWQWGKDATDPSAKDIWGDEAYADAQFQKMKTSFVDKGIPVILGEYGAYEKPAYPGMRPYVQYWDQYITHSAYAHGLVPMYWDTGALFNRSTGAQKDPTVIATIVDAAK